MKTNWRLLAVLGVAACSPTAPPPVPEPVPVSNGVPQQTGVNNDTGSYAQSETAVGFVGGTTANGTTVAVYNDFSQSKTNPLFDGVTYTAGYTILGRSTSADGGQTWTYGGQVSPPAGWSAIGNDPSLVSDGVTTYVASLAVSNSAWATIALSSQPNKTTTNPFAVTDGFCVSTSFDGGLSFQTPVCTKVTDVTTGHVTDRTAITFDSLHQIWVAVVDKPTLGSPAVRVFHSNISASGNYLLADPTPPLQLVHEPVLRHDAEGNVYLGGLGTTTEIGSFGKPDVGIWLVKYDVSSNLWSPFPLLADHICGRTVTLKSVVVLDSLSGFKVRNGHTYDFDVGSNEPSPTGLGGDGKTTREVMRFVWEVSRPDGRDYIEAAEYDANPLGSTCRIEPQPTPTSQPSGSTFNSDGVQGMPSMKYGGSGNWWTAYLTTSGSLAGGPYVRPEARRVIVPFAPVVNAPGLANNVDLAPNDWSACVTTQTSWGDYFGLTPTSNAHVAAFTSSRPGPSACANGLPQHVVSQRW